MVGRLQKMIGIVLKLASALSILDNKSFFNSVFYFKSAIYIGFISHRFRTFGARSIIFLKPRLLVGEEFIEIGSNVRVSPNIQLTAWKKDSSDNPLIYIGNNSNIGESAHITAANCIIIGDNFLCGKNVLISDNSHGMSKLNELYIAPALRTIYSKGPVVIRNNVWIGDKATMLPNVEIGEDAIIAANSVVTRNIPAFCIAAGVPAKVIKNLSK